MSDDVVQRFSELLLEARRSHTTLTSLPRDLQAVNFATAQKIQAEVERRLDPTIGGWKVGKMPSGEAYCAPVFNSVLYPSPARIVAADHPGLCVEGEIAFRMGRSLPARDKPYSLAEVIDAIDHASIAIEVLCWRVPNGHNSPYPHRVADHLGNGALVFGEPNTNWEASYLNQLRVKLEIGGRVIFDGASVKDADHDPLALLVWTTNHLGARGGVKAGDIITTGTWVGTHPSEAGDVTVVTFEGLGEARLELV